MEIQQHDGVVVEVAGSRQGFAKRKRGERCCRGRGRRQGLLCCCPPSPTIYRPPGGAPALGDQISKGGRRPRGKGGGFPPKPSGAPPTPRVSNPRRRGRPRGGAPAH